MLKMTEMGFSPCHWTIIQPILLQRNINRYKKYLTLFKQDMPGYKEQYLEKGAVDTEVLEALDNTYNLIVWNDEVNTFEWVIETLVEVCGHSEEQAEQCAMIIHTQGKYAVKQGSYDDLKPMCDAIIDRGIGATIEVLAL
jgi:ATP-dependent Clp protease adaptor protein ClpS